MSPERHTPRIAWVALVVMTLVTTSAILAAVAANRVWDPIADFPVQVVNEVTEESVSVTGTKCYRERVDVVGSFWWQSVEPPGVVLGLLTGTGQDREGCVTQTFVNLIPEEVREADEALGGAVWMLTGHETPIDTEGGREGLLHTWRTEPFQLE